MGKFSEWLKTETDDPVAAWKAARAAAGWAPPPASTVGAAKPVTVAAPRPEPTQKGPSFPPAVVDLLTQGFQSGSIVPDSLVRSLGLKGKNYSLVANGTMNVTGHAYPFYAEKRAGQPTGKIFFVRGFPIDKFMREIGELS